MSRPGAHHSLDLEAIQQMEGKLQQMLSPVRPDPRFVDQLRQRLRTTPAIVLEPRSGKTAVLLVALGLFCGVFITWLLRRLLA